MNGFYPVCPKAQGVQSGDQLPEFPSISRRITRLVRPPDGDHLDYGEMIISEGWCHDRDTDALEFLKTALFNREVKATVEWTVLQVTRRYVM